MVKNVEVQNKNNESNANLIRRFSRRVRHSQLLNNARSNQYYKREKSENIKKKKALKKKRRLEEVEKLIKLGKLPDRRNRRKIVSLNDEEN